MTYMGKKGLSAWSMFSAGKKQVALIDKAGDFFYTKEKHRFFQEYFMSARLFTQSFAGQWWRIFSSGRGCGLGV